MRTKAVNYTAIIFSAWIVALVITLMVSFESNAGQIEHDVITEGYENLWLAYDAETDTIDYDHVALAQADLLEIFEDTAEGSFCESYAAGAYIVALSFVPPEEADMSTLAMYRAGEIVYDELPRIAESCLEEA